MHDICAKMKSASSALAKDFVCEKCVKTMKEIVEPEEELSFHDDVEFVEFFYLGDEVNVSGGSEAAVIARTKIGSGERYKV